MQPLQTSLIDYIGFGGRCPQTLLFDSSVSVNWGVMYFAFLYDYHTNYDYDWDTRWRTAVGKYNGGPYSAETNGVFLNSSVEDYVNSVLQNVNGYQPYRND
jgi:hypothetical protein